MWPIPVPPHDGVLMGVGGFDLAAIIRSIYRYPIGAAVPSLGVGQSIDLALWNTGIKSPIHTVSLKVYYSHAFVWKSPLRMKRRDEIMSEIIS